MSDQLDFLIRNLPNLLIGFPSQRPGGLALSIGLAVVGLSIGMLLAVFVGSAAASQRWSLRAAAAIYIWIFRGIPLLLLLLILHNIFGAGRVGFTTSSVQSALIALVLYSSAYQASIVAAGLRSVPQELVDDARVLGATPFRAWRTVQLPYGLATMRPAFISQAVSLFKDTSVVVVLGVADLTTTARIALGTNVDNAPFWVATYLTVGLLYFAVATIVSSLANQRNGPKGPEATGLVQSLGAVSSGATWRSAG